MVVHLEDIHGADAIDRADQLRVHVPGQITAVEKLKIAERQ